MDDTEDPKLSDVIGSLVSSMVHARTVADMEALRIAYHYRQNEFLQGLPIPRLRLQKVSISMPVVLTSVQPGRRAKANHPIEIAEAVYKAMPAALNLCRMNVEDGLQLVHIGPERKITLERILR